MKTIRMKVENNVLSLLPNQEVKQIVCGNDCYQLEIEFDSDWANNSEKVARFIYNNRYVNKKFTGKVCTVPVLSNTTAVVIGFYAEGNDKAATNTITIPCDLSVLCVEVEKTPVTLNGKWVVDFGENQEVSREVANIIQSNGEKKEYISFSVGGDNGTYTFTCEKGMAWGAFAYSENENFDEMIYFTIGNYGTVHMTIAGGEYQVYGLAEETVYGNHIIDENIQYICY